MIWRIARRRSLASQNASTKSVPTSPTTSSALTTTDVAQRLKAFEDELSTYPDDELQAGCLALYEKEKAEGTELPAFIGQLRDHVEREEERIRTEQHERYQQSREEDRVAREQRLLSGADCRWTQLQRSQHWYCRANGRTYRPRPKTRCGTVIA